MIRYAVGLGSNLGDRLALLREGIAGLEGIGQVIAISGLYESAPVGGPDQGPYLNAVAVVESELQPTGVLENLNRIEAEQGRERRQRWGARTLDLDIISADGLEIAEPDLQVPHARAQERQFVLMPLMDVWPEAMVSDQLTAQQASAQCEDQSVDRLARTWADETPRWTGRVFVAIQMVWFVAIAVALAFDGTLPDGSADPFRIIGGLVAAFGAALAFIASRRLGPALTAVPEPTADSLLIQTGPYRMVRHPIYGGVTLFILGTSMILDSLTGALLSLGLLPFFYFKSEYEEKVLRIRYPEYWTYRQVVARRFVPFVF